MPTNDDSMIKVMESLGLNFNPAESAIKSFEGRIAALNKQLFDLKANAMAGARDINQAFSSQMGGMVGNSTIAALGAQYAKNNVILDQYGNVLKKVNTDTESVNKSFESSTNAARKHATTVQEVSKQYNILGNEFSRRASWFATGGLFYGGINAGVEAVKSISEVEMGVTQIARVMEDSTFVFKDYRNELLQMGVDYGTSFANVQDIALRWAQAGYNVRDSLENTKTSLLALNSAELNSSQATESMIGIMSQWQLTSKDLPLLLDKINKTADDFTVTSQDLVDGLLRSSGAAKIMGLSIDKTIALLTVMREASGRTGREVGNALNSILSYIQRPSSIKLLEGLGIPMFADAAKTQFRDVMEIFKDIAGSWNTLAPEIQDGFIKSADDAGLFNEELANAIGVQQEWNDLQQRDISQAAAGVYRRNYFIGMIERLSGAQKVLNTMTDAAGYSQAENARTMETLEKQYNSLQTAAKQLAITIGDAGLAGELKGLVAGAAGSLEWFNSLDSEMKNLIITFAEVTVAVRLLQATGLFAAGGLLNTGNLNGLFKGASASLAIAKIGPEIANVVGYATAAIKNIGSGLLSAFGGPWGIGLTLATTGLITYINHQKELEKQVKETEKAQASFNSKLSEFNNSVSPERIQKVADSFQQLKTALKYDDSTPQKIEEIKNKIQALQETNVMQSAKGYTFGTNDIEIAKLQSQLDELQGKYNQVADAEEKLNQAKERATALDYQSYQNMVRTISGTIKEIEADKQLVQQYEDSLSAQKEDQSIRDQLLDKYPQYLKVVGEHSDQIGINTDALTSNLNIQEDLAKAQIVEAQIAMRTSHEKTQKILDDTQARISALRAEQDLYNYTGDNWLDPVRVKIADDIMRSLHEVEQLKTTLGIQENFINMSPDELLKAYSTASKRISTNGGSGETGTDTGYIPSLDKNVLNIDRYMQLNSVLDDINNAIEQNNVLEQEATDTGKLQYLAKENELMQQKKQALNDIQWEKGQEASEIRAAMEGQGFNFDDSGNILNFAARLEDLNAWANALPETSKAENEYKKDQIKMIQDFENSGKHYYEIMHKDIPNLVKEISQAGVSIAKNINTAQKSATDAIKNSLKDQQDLIDEAYKNRIDLIEKEVEEKKKAQQDIIDDAEKAQKQLERAESTHDYNNKLVDLKKDLAYWSVRTSEEARKKVADISKQIAEEEHDRQVELDKQGLEDKKQAAQDEIDNIEETAKKEKDKWETAYKNIKKAFDSHNLDIIANATSTSKAAFSEWEKNYILPIQNALKSGGIDAISQASTSISGYIDNARESNNATNAALNEIAWAKSEYTKGYNAGDTDMMSWAAAYAQEQYAKLPADIAEQAKGASYEEVMQLRSKYPKAHTGAQVLGYGAAVLKPGELIFPPNLSTKLESLISVLNGKSVQQTQSISTDRRVILQGPLFNSEKTVFEDDTDMESMARELKHAIISLS